MTANGDFYDKLEIRDPEQREAEQFAELRGLIALAKDKAPYWQRTLAEVEAGDIDSRDALSSLPVTRKSDLMEVQAADPPFGGMTIVPVGEFRRVFRSPGPICEPMGVKPDWFRGARSLYAAGFRKGDVVHNTFSYHFTPGAFMMESAAEALGCTVFPGGVGQTEQQVEAIRHFGAVGFMGTPDFLKIVLDKAEEMGTALPSLAKALVGGGALFPSLRAEIQGKGVNVMQNYGTADVGLVAYETPALEGMVLAEGVIVEIVRPGSGDPVPDGEVGEVVVTTLTDDYPLFRFATGDMSAVDAGQSSCGRTNTRIKGWMGRADQTAKVRGMFIRPEQVNRVLARHPEIARLRLVVGSENNLDTATLMVEAPTRDDAFRDTVAESFRAECKMRGRIEFADSLPNDGKVIDDQRSYD
ncbi:MAG: AMP-binding protein [Alphaproteobacteria bacterium]|nr:AMP-binding protein [Alphaproteobacteria bacterium]